MDERYYWLAFSNAPKIGPATFKLLLETFGSAKDAWESSKDDLEDVLGDQLTERFYNFKKKFSIEDYVRQMDSKKVSFVTLVEKEYPELLQQIERPPFIVYIRGQYWFNNFQNEHTIAVVGSRKVTSYGKEVTESITSQLVGSGFIIVSGLALGVDAIAHKTAIENSGKTIAVLGCGVDCCYPRENQNLYNEIIEKGGAIISEFPLAQQPNVGTFPSRNRIVSGLSLGVVVTEGAEDSGSLITADYAFKQQRKVFAVPGPITSGLSKGPLQLIQKGAKMITSGKDVLQELAINSKQLTVQKEAIKGDTAQEQMILDLLMNESLSFDDIVRRSKLNSPEVGTLLSLMEIKGYIRSSNEGNYSLAT